MPTVETKRAAPGHIGPIVEKPSSWWLAALKKRASRMYEEKLDWSEPLVFASEAERAACIRFFNAAYRAEESGKTQAHALAERVASFDPDLGECLILYGNEEGWHHELLTEFLQRLAGGIRPLSGFTKVMYDVYAKADTLETIMLTNLMFETIGATTYRLCLGTRKPTGLIRQVLTILTRDESFHVPLNVHFIRQTLAARGYPTLTRLKLQAIYDLVFTGLIASAWRSRRAAGAFDHIPFATLSRFYVENLGRLALDAPDLGLLPSRVVLAGFGLTRATLARHNDDWTSAAAAARMADRAHVSVDALSS
jgi:hypothetical protein